jgi:hypothetical protein
MHTRIALAAAILAYCGIASGLTIDLGQFTLSNAHTAHINVVNPGPGWIEVRLVFSDGGGKTILEHTETLAARDSATLALAGNSPVASRLRAEVVALSAAAESACRPDATLQITPKNPVTISSISRGSIRVVPLNANEDAAKQALRTIAQAQGLYFESKRARGEPPTYAISLEELERSGILPKGYGQDLDKLGYKITIVLGLLTHRTGINRTGDRAFFVDETGVIRTDTAPGPNSCADALFN